MKGYPLLTHHELCLRLDFRSLMFTLASANVMLVSQMIVPIVVKFNLQCHFTHRVCELNHFLYLFSTVFFTPVSLGGNLQRFSGHHSNSNNNRSLQCKYDLEPEKKFFNVSPTRQFAHSSFYSTLG